MTWLPWIASAMSLLPTGVSAQIRHDDYPALAMRMHHEGIVRYRVEYDQQGRLTDCAITASSGFADLDAQTCAVLKRDSHAVPQAPGAREGSITWRLPT